MKALVFGASQSLNRIGLDCLPSASVDVAIVQLDFVFEAHKSLGRVRSGPAVDPESPMISDFC